MVRKLQDFVIFFFDVTSLCPFKCHIKRTCSLGLSIQFDLLQLGSLDPSGYLKKGKEESRTNMKAQSSLEVVTLLAI